MPLYIHATDFYATEYSVSLISLGLTLLVLRLFDAIQDPLIGLLSDKFHNWRFRIIAISMLILSIGFYALFRPMQDHVLTWFGVSMLIATTAFSIATINLNALGALWSHDYHQKTRITAFREGIALIGILIASSLPGILQLFESRQNAFIQFSILLMVVCVIALLIFYHWYHYERPLTHQSIETSKTSEHKVVDLLSQITKHRWFYSVYTMSMLASSIPAVLVLFFIRDRLGAEAYSGLFLFIYFGSGILGMPLWHYLARKFDKQTSWLFAMSLAVASFLWAYTLHNNELIEYGLICIFSGFALGAELVLPPSILADLIQHSQSTHRASTQFAMLTFLSKLCFALASGTALLILGISSFETAQINSSDALIMLSFCYALLPSMIKCMAILMLWRWMKRLKVKRYENPDIGIDPFISHS